MSRPTLIFDFDGTIADSLAALVAIGNRLAPEYGCHSIQADDIPRLRDATYRELMQHLGVSPHKVPLLVRRVHQELARDITKIPLIEGLPSVLSALAERGHRLAILTSNSRRNVERFLEHHQLDCFEFISVSSNLFGKETRLRSLLKRKRLRVDQCIYIGDEARDVVATRPLGMSMIAVTWGFATAARLRKYGPEHVIDRPQQLLEVLG